MSLRSPDCLGSQRIEQLESTFFLVFLVFSEREIETRSENERELAGTMKCSTGPLKTGISKNGGLHFDLDQYS